MSITYEDDDSVVFSADSTAEEITSYMERKVDEQRKAVLADYNQLWPLLYGKFGVICQFIMVIVNFLQQEK
jgi:hypothetical protein